MFPLSNQAGTPGSVHAAPVEPAADQPGKATEPPTPWGDRQLCQSRRPSPESRIVVRAKAVKVVGKSQSRSA